jgi:lysozyme
MHLSTAGLNFIKQSEGFRSQTYLDAASLPTIGYGHRLLHAQSFPEGIGESEATALLAADVRDAEQAVQRLVKVALTQGQFDALVDFCFNLGQGRLAASTLLKVLNGGRYAAAAEQLLLWDQAGGKPLAALKARREGELNLWNSAPSQSSQTAA